MVESQIKKKNCSDLPVSEPIEGDRRNWEIRFVVCYKKDSSLSLIYFSPCLLRNVNFSPPPEKKKRKKERKETEQLLNSTSALC